MQTIGNASKDNLKKIIKKSVKETLQGEKIKDLFFNVIDNISLLKAIDEGLLTETLGKEVFVKKLESRINWKSC